MTWAQKGGATVVALILFILFYVLVWRIPTTTPVIAVCVTDYPAPLPVNAWAYEDWENMASLGDSNYLRPQYTKNDVEDVSGAPEEFIALKSATAVNDWLKALGVAIEAGVGNAGDAKTVVLYLSMHGAVDDAGRPCLIPAARNGATHADLLNSGAWISLADVLDVIEKQAGDKHVLLALDANRIDMQWDLGILSNEFAQAAATVVDNGGKPREHVTVINSTGPNQLGWASPEMGRSVFGFYLEHGLRGAADAEGNNDEFVTVAELLAYLQRNVNGFVSAQFGGDVRQMPELWPQPTEEAPLNDFQVVRCEGRHEAPALKAMVLDRAKTMKTSLAGLNAELNATGENVAWRLRPEAWEQFRADALRLEQVLAAGSAYAHEITALDKKLSGYQLNAPVNDPGFAQAAVSLPLNRRFNSDFLNDYSPHDQQAFVEQVEGLANPPPATAPAADASVTAKPAAESSAAVDAAGGADTKPATDAAPPAAEKAGETKKLIEQPDPAVRTLFAWNWFIASPHSRDEFVRMADALLPSGASDVETPLVELQWMRLLQRDISDAQWPARAELICTLSSLRDRSEELAALVVADPKEEKQYARLDLRALAQLRGLLEAAEARRRECEDLAFLNQFEDCAQKAQEVLSEYKALNELASELDQAWTALDGMRTAAPHLVAWKLRLQSYEGKSAWNVEKTRQLLTSIAKLESALSAPGAATLDETAAATTNVQTALNEARQRFQPLATDYEEAVKLVATNAKSNKIYDHLRRVTALLATPGLKGGQRAALLARRDDLAAETFSTRPSPANTSSESSSLATRPLDLAVLQELAAWSTGIPLSELSGKTLRARLVAARADEDKSLLDAWSSKAGAAQRGGELVKLDGQSRRLAAFAPLALEKDKLTVAEPAEQLAWNQLSDFSAWQNQRVQDDFLGDVNPQFAETKSASDSRAATANYFDLAAQKLIEAQVQFADARANKQFPATTAIKDALLSVAGASREQLKRRQDAAKAGFVPSAGELPPRLFGTEKRNIDFTGGAELPPGLAAVWVPKVDGLLQPSGNDPTLRSARVVGIPESPPPLEFQFDLAKTSLEGLRPTAYFRGHYWRSEWKTANVGEPRIAVYTPADRMAPQVRVEDPRTDQLAFSVILDCSASMTPKPGDGPDRMQPAINAVMAALEPVASQKKHRLSFRLFAHRFKYDVPNDRREFFSSPYFEKQEVERARLGRPPIPLKHPNEDIEIVLPMSRFQPAELKTLRAELNGVRAYGGTPLYLSIAQALKEDRPNVPPGYRHHVLVITDGENKLVEESLVFENQPAIVPTVPQPTLENLIKLVKQSGSQLDILAIIPKPKDPATSEIARLGDATAGICEFDVTGNTLIGQLRRAIGLRDFQLVDNRNATLSEQYQLGATATLLPSAPLPQENVIAELVRFSGGNDNTPRSESFPLRGGEAIVLQLTDKGDVVHKPTEPGANDPVERSSAFVAWANSPDPTELVNKDEEVTFRVSIRHPDATRYLAPPVEAWAEIALPPRDGQPRTYLAYDMKRQPGMPITVLEWTIHGHALQNDEQAKLRVWWRDRPASVLPAELRLAGLMTEEGMRPEGAPGLTLKGKLEDDGTTLTIEESHDEPAEGFGVNAMTDTPWYRIELVDQAENTLSITREFYPQVGGAVHRFKLKKEAASGIQSARVSYSLLDRPSESSTSAGIQHAEFPAVKIPYLNQGTQ